MFEKERKENFERYTNVDEYDAVQRWHCRLDEPKPASTSEADAAATDRQIQDADYLLPILVGGNNGDVTVHGFRTITGECVTAGSPSTTAAPDAALPSAGCSTLPGTAAQETV